MLQYIYKNIKILKGVPLVNKKKIAILLELVPIISAILSFVFIIIDYNSEITNMIITEATFTSFLGFVFFFIGRRLNKESKIVRILGIFDWFATFYVIALYTIVIFIFGL